jgi:hypothetical protein
MPTRGARSPYSRQLVARQMPSVFSRKAVRPSRAFTWCPEQLGNRVAAVDLDPPVIAIHAALSPRLAITAKSCASSSAACRGALILDAEIEFPDVFLLQHRSAGVGHDDAADLQDVAVVGGLQRHVGVLLDQQDR